MEVGEEEGRDVSHRQRDAVREMTAETDGGVVADGRRWEVEHLGEAEGWRGVKDSVDRRCRIKEEARQTARQRPDWEQQRRLAASAINNASGAWCAEHSACLARDSDALHHRHPQQKGRTSRNRTSYCCRKIYYFPSSPHWPTFCLHFPCKINRNNEEPYTVRSAHCATILQVVNSKRSSLLHSSQDTVWAKTNRHSGEIKGGTGVWRILKKQQMTFFKFSSPPLVSFLWRVSFSGSPSLLFTLPVMVIYLVGKASSFSPERDRQKGGRKVKKQERWERSTNRSKEQKISLALVSLVTATVSLTALMELKVLP